MSTTIINKYNGFFTLGKLYKFHYTKTTSVNVIFGYKRTCKQCSEPMGHSLSSTKGMTVNSDTTLMLLLTNILSLTDLYNHPIFLVFTHKKLITWWQWLRLILRLENTTLVKLM